MTEKEGREIIRKESMGGKKILNKRKKEEES